MCSLKVRSGEICVIMTTFDPEPSIADRISDIIPQVGHIILVNDSGSEKVKNKLYDLFSTSDKISLIHNETNSGIAYSLNVGVQLANKIGYSWLLTLDDDSRVKKDFVDKLLQSYEMAISQYKVGIISLSRENNQGETKPIIVTKRGAITSGSFFSFNVFELAGGFREELFIDLVDYDFCIKIRKLGYSILKSSEVGMFHPVGKITSHNLFGYNIKTYNHPAFRKYYIARNSIVLSKENIIYDPLLSFVLIWDVFYTFIKVLLFEVEKVEKVKCLVKGVFHGVINKFDR